MIGLRVVDRYAVLEFGNWYGHATGTIRSRLRDIHPSLLNLLEVLDVLRHALRTDKMIEWGGKRWQLFERSFDTLGICIFQAHFSIFSN